MPSETPDPYKLKGRLFFQLFVSQNSADTFVIWNSVSPYDQYRPELTKDGDIIPYKKLAQRETEREAPPSGSGAPFTFEPGREYGPQQIDLDNWYDSVVVGSYELIVRKRFIWDGDWVVSNPVYFEVLPRPPASPVPAGVSIELAPEGLQPKTGGQPYQLGGDVQITLFVTNKSDQSLKVNVIDREYGNRPQLFKNGALVPYLEEATALIKSKEQNPRLVEIVNDFFLDPQIGTWVQGLNLKKWYGPLPPGSYRLIIRHRFEMDGPWSAETAPLLFEVAPGKK